jgi:hypothetical protein
MFQYAAGRCLAVLNDTELKLDVSHYEHHQDRRLGLSVFNLEMRLASYEEITAINGCPPGERRRGLARHLDRVRRRLNPFDRRRVIREEHLHFDPRVLRARGDLYLMGYWQSYRYFEPVADLVRRDFTFRTPPSPRNTRLMEEMQAEESVSLHVRRGDYVGHSVFEMRDPLDYYRRCVSDLADRRGRLRLYVFSDDVQWVQGNLKFDWPTVFVAHNRPPQDYEDLRLMSACKHNIIVNSSFSWWAAWLNPNPDKVVCAPRQWANKAGRDSRDVTPPEWIRL